MMSPIEIVLVAILIGDQDEDYDKGIYWSREQIKQHFGVTE